MGNIQGTNQSSPNFTSRVRIDYSSAQRLNKYFQKYPEQGKNIIKQIDEFKHNGDNNLVELTFDQTVNQSGMFKQLVNKLGLRIIDDTGANKKVSQVISGEPIKETFKYNLNEDGFGFIDDTGRLIDETGNQNPFETIATPVNLKEWYEITKTKMIELKDNAEDFFKFC